MNRKWLNEEQNDAFSTLKGMDLRTLLNEMETFNLTYRPTLGLDYDKTFGIEIEEEGISEKLVQGFLWMKHLHDWQIEEDNSLESPECEIVSPVLRDSAKTWHELKKICTFLKSKNMVTTQNAGGHIHVGSHILGHRCKNWRTLLKLYACYEPVLFRFGYGDKLTPRFRNFYYANSVAENIYDLLQESKNDLNLSELKRICYDFAAFSLQDDFMTSEFVYDKSKTIEYRFPNTSAEEVIWQNNINAVVKMTMAATQEIDTEFLDYKLEQQNKSNIWRNHIGYREILIQDALEFVDLVFDNNLDKVYFLRQYFKSFETAHGLDQCIYAKSFIKK